MKFVLIAFVILVVVFWLSRGKKVAGRRDRRAGARTATPGTRAVEQIVRCAHCGLHVPASEAVTAPDGVRYCTEAHRRLGARTP